MCWMIEMVRTLPAVVVLTARMVAAVISAFQQGVWRQRKVNLPVVSGVVGSAMKRHKSIKAWLAEKA